MFSKELLARCLTAARNRATVSTPKSTISWATQRYASTSAMSIGNKAILDHTFLQYTPSKVSVASVSEHVSRLRPFSVPAPPQPTMTTPTKAVEELELTSVLRKRRLKMNKHKHKKLRKRTRALRKKLGK